MLVDGDVPKLKEGPFVAPPNWKAPVPPTLMSVDDETVDACCGCWVLEPKVKSAGAAFG